MSAGKLEISYQETHCSYYVMLLIHSYFNYCNIVLACQDNVYTQSLYRFKKSSSSDSLSSMELSFCSAFKRLNINICDINKRHAGCFVYKYFNGLLRLSFTDYYTGKSTIHMITIGNS